MSEDKIFTNIIKFAEKFINKHDKFPSIQDFAAAGIPRRHILNKFGTMEELKIFLVSGNKLTAPESTYKHKKSNKTFIVTCAQNNTKIHEQFFYNLLAYAGEINATVLVLQQLYSNPTGYTKVGSDIQKFWWDERIRSDLWLTASLPLNKNLVIRGDVRIQATAPNPLTGLDNITGSVGAVFGHSQVEVRYTPSAHNDYPKLLATTGSCCVKGNYSNTSRGARADFHHTLGAQIIEIEGDYFHNRQINATSDGAFYDLHYYVKDQKITDDNAIEALTAGDLHVEYSDPLVIKATFLGDNSIMAALNPARLILHDVLDFKCQSHHNTFIDKIALARDKRDIVQKEIDKFVEFLEELPDDTEIGIVHSNHDDHIKRWFEDANVKSLSYANLEFYSKLLALVIQHTKLNINGSVDNDWLLQLIITKLYKVTKKLTFISPNDFYDVGGADGAQHGHKGAAGARGTRNHFAKLGNRMNIGHGHSPGIKFGCFQSGHCAYLNRGYDDGYSGALHSHIVTYPNGKRTLINVINGKWRS